VQLPRSLVRSLTLSAVALLSLAGCPGGDDDDDDDDDDSDIDAGPDPACAEAVDHSDLAWLQEHVFTPTCSDFTVCHQGRALQAEGLNLEDGDTFEELVNQPSSLFPEKLLVVPFEPENSYLMVAIGQIPGELGEGGTMPYNNPLMCVEKRDAIQRWIEQGAREFPLDAGVDAAPDAALDGGVDGAPGDAAPIDAPF
jgi:hypothetical protein